MQFRVPQNIAMEDRIVGPLTAIQFGILVVGGFIAFFLFTATVLPDPINKILGGGFALFTVTMAIGKFNDQPMYRFMRFIVAFIATPKVRVWHKSGPEIPIIRPSSRTNRQQQTHASKKVSKQDIARLAVVLDSRGASGLPPKVTPPETHAH